MKKNISILFILIISLISFSVEAAGQSEIKIIYSKIKNSFEHKKKNQIELLFFQHAPQGTIEPLKGKPGCYKLTLSHLYNKVVYFANQPSRETGSLTIPQFITTWEHNQKVYGVKPNSVLEADAVLSSTQVKTIHDVATFSDPNYDSKNNTLSYNACSIGSSKQMSHPQLKDVNIFFDPFHRWPP